MKLLLSTVLKAELKFHCKAVEEISSVLSSLKEVEDIDYENGRNI